LKEKQATTARTFVLDQQNRDNISSYRPNNGENAPLINKNLRRGVVRESQSSQDVTSKKRTMANEDSDRDDTLSKKLKKGTTLDSVDETAEDDADTEDESPAKHLEKEQASKSVKIKKSKTSNEELLLENRNLRKMLEISRERNNELKNNVQRIPDLEQEIQELKENYEMLVVANEEFTTRDNAVQTILQQFISDVGIYVAAIPDRKISFNDVPLAQGLNCSVLEKKHGISLSNVISLAKQNRKKESVVSLLKELDMPVTGYILTRYGENAWEPEKLKAAKQILKELFPSLTVPNVQSLLSTVASENRRTIKEHNMEGGIPT